ncbi:MAG TPA: hypothetical protein VFG83_16640 [Kofleriaceae bacterium]|nr:hypothetical protein [Kofleriaceae bacterium]
MSQPENQPDNVVPICGPVGDALAGFQSLIPEGLLAKLDDPEFIAEQDRRYEARQRREQAAEARIRLDTMRRGGAPRRATERVANGSLEGTMAMAAIEAWSGQGLLVLSGGVGCGKTTAAVWWLSRHGGTAPMFVRAGGLEAAGRYDRAVRAMWTASSALCIDDVGAEYADGRGNWISLLDEIADFYHGEMRPLIMTTNIEKAVTFRQRMGDRISSRIREDGGWCPIGGDDLRGRK